MINKKITNYLTNAKKDIKFEIKIENMSDVNSSIELLTELKKYEKELLQPLEADKKALYEPYNEVVKQIKAIKDKAGEVKAIITKEINNFNAIEAKRKADEIANSKEQEIITLDEAVEMKTNPAVKEYTIYTLQIVDEAKIPEIYIIKTINESAILDHFKNTGELIPGTNVEVRKEIK